MHIHDVCCFVLYAYGLLGVLGYCVCHSLSLGGLASKLYYMNEFFADGLKKSRL